MVNLSAKSALLASVLGATLASASALHAKPLVAGAPLGPKQIDQLPATEPTIRSAYGSDPLQFGELRVPDGKGPFPIAIVIHGGCWTKGYATARNTASMASALTKRGIATWNIEYRQAGDPGGGWPGTFLDWAAAADHLRVLARVQPLDLRNVVSVGHSAGAHAALWLAARHRLPRGSEIKGQKPLRIRGAVAIDGPGDLTAIVGRDAQVCRRPVIAPFMGGTPEERPDRYKQASPAALLPLRAEQHLVQSSVLTPDEAEAYRSAASRKGDKVTVTTLGGRMHFNMIAPSDPTFAAVEKAVEAIVRQRR